MIRCGSQPHPVNTTRNYTNALCLYGCCSSRSSAWDFIFAATTNELRYLFSHFKCCNKPDIKLRMWD